VAETGTLIRRGGRQDVPFLKAMLRHAYHWHVSALDESDVPIARYVENWGRPGDEALVALEAGHPIGAAWLRVFPQNAPGWGFVDAGTPELTIAVVPSRRKHGVGNDLLNALLDRAKEAGYGAVTLSVEKESPAVRFYERHGFAVVADAGMAVTMKRDL
jgi:GNAT superfamily N-acetyltransferase